MGGAGHRPGEQGRQMKATRALAGLALLAVPAPAAAQDADRSMARCRMEYLKNEDALRFKKDQFYSTCMTAEGFYGSAIFCPADESRCYSAPPKPATTVEKTQDWLKSWLK